jgi:hypothetical protein
MIKTMIIRRVALNSVLLVVILGLFWFIFSKLNHSTPINTLYDASMGEEIHTILIVSHNTNIELQKVTGHWVMTQPITTEIDERAIQHLMTLLFDPIDASYPMNGKNRVQFGLDNDPVSVAFNGVEIQFGTLNPVSHKRYLRKGDRVYMVAETVYGLLTGGIDGFLAVQVH